MRILHPLKLLGSLANAGKRPDKVSARVRRILVKSLYDQPLTLIIGGLTGVGASAVAAFVTGRIELQIGTIVLAIIAIGRVMLAYSLLPERRRFSTRFLELSYEVGAFSYSLSVGTLAALALSSEAPASVQVLTVANALFYGVAASARNAGRPSIAIGQLILVSVPIMFVCAQAGTLVHWTMFATLVLLLVAMSSITKNIFRVLRDSITSAETSRKLAAKMESLARTDVVTGLANRAGLNFAMVETMMKIEDGDRLALIWIDLDRFKEVNDLLGHPVGDRVLDETARRLKEVCPNKAVVSRFGGDEFVICTPIDAPAQAEKLASEIHASIMGPMRIEGDRLEVRASIGVALYPEHGQDSDTLMQSADLALYRAKLEGRGRTCFFDSAMTADMLRRREIEEELRAAIQRDELCVFYQPIIDLDTGRIRSFEALVRWFHPEKGELQPEEFIPVAEESGVILTLGNWIAVQAARTASGWPEDIGISMNLSPLQIRAPGAALGIKNALREAGLDPARLELEVTESLFVGDHHTTAAFIEELSAIGVRFALDDFGIGYSSLGYINNFPFDTIKVDRSFISGENVGRRSDAIIGAVAEMGSQLGMAIVAEGLETPEQVASVRKAGCTLGQGFHFSPALPDHLAKMLIDKERAETRRTAV